MQNVSDGCGVDVLTCTYSMKFNNSFNRVPIGPRLQLIEIRGAMRFTPGEVDIQPSLDRAKSATSRRFHTGGS